MNEEVVRMMVSGLIKLGVMKGEVEELIAEQAHRQFFMHGLSHWLGLDVHDVGITAQPIGVARLSGMVLTIEPGPTLRLMPKCRSSTGELAYVSKITS